MTYTCTIETPLGAMTAAAVDEALVGLWFNGQKYFPAHLAQWSAAPDHPLFGRLRMQLEGYFSGRSEPWAVKLAPQGSPFQMAVWEALTRIPYGTTSTYGELAREIAATRGIASMSAQAVGGAVGHNPVSIIIPCHRVVGCKGSLTGYAGGLERKEALLRLEGSLRGISREGLA